jgi:hypothetical protein
MAKLTFVCPLTRRRVETEINLDAQSFAGLPRETTALPCPYCNEPHLLSEVSAWLGQLQTEHE